jgi:predicted amidohydrolase
MKTEKLSPLGLARRRLVGAAAGSAILAATHAGSSAGTSTLEAQRDEKSIDLLICGGRVIDPAQGLDPVRDVALRKGKIERLAAEIQAAQVFNFGTQIGTLRPGAEAEVNVLELREGELTFTDSGGKTRTGRQKLFPFATVRGGKVFDPSE